MTKGQSMAKKMKMPKLQNVKQFDHLEPYEYESLFLRTQRTLEDIKEAYKSCCAGPLDINRALQFAIDPLGWNKVNPKAWIPHLTDRGIILCKMTGDTELKFVEDRMTVELLRLFIDESAPVNWKKRVSEDFDDDAVLTAQFICKRYQIPRPTFQAWEKGIKSANLDCLKCVKDPITAETTCRYGDLVPFLNYYFNKLKKKNKPS